MKILIVDDEADVRDLIARSLAYGQPDLIPVHAATGDEALRLVATDQPDLMVLDLILPGKDGFRVLEELRRISDLPVIVLTAKGLERERVRGLELGADDYVMKPFSPRELVARVEAVMRRAGPAASRRGSIEQGPLRIDLAARRVLRDGKGGASHADGVQPPR